MNKFIETQLKRCRVAKIPNFDENTTELIIHKNGSVVEIKEWEEGYSYQIFIDDSLVIPGDWYKTIHGNWNKGNGPSSNRMNITIDKVMGKMLKLHGIQLEDGKEWSGWLPKGNVRKLKDL